MLPGFGVVHSLLPVDLAIAARASTTTTSTAHVAFHISDVIELGHVAVFLHIRAFVLGHTGDEVVDDFVRDEGVTEVEFGDIWLGGSC
jgi:hypothetical protein